MFKTHPEKLRRFSDHPSKVNCATFAEVLTIDEMQCDIVAAVIGCHCAESMKLQQRDAMAVRQSFWRTPREWIMAVEQKTGSIPPEYDAAIRRITRRFARVKQCHRNWFGARAGIRCYCDEHSHENLPSERR
ncbi:MAG: hypothetical protein HY475_02165 [Candidatus Terrybacteria bacterium]|nr:hypothetical protein [Candidatus Terrybacteria bacterium]